MTLKDLWRYGSRYLGWLLLTMIATLAFFHFLPNLQTAFTGLLPVMFAAILTNIYFVQYNERYLHRNEYWMIVILCTMIYFVLLTPISIVSFPYERPHLAADPSMWAVLFVALFLSGLLTNMLFFTRLLVRPQLDHIKRKRDHEAQLLRIRERETTT